MSLLQPPNFHHHSLDLHLAFICAHKGRRPSGECKVLSVRGKSFEACETEAMCEFLNMGLPETWVLAFLGHVA